MKKIMAVVLCLTTFFTLLSVSASAATIKVTDKSGTLSITEGGYFSGDKTALDADVSYGNSWELYAYYKSDATVIRFGFNDWATDEDYVYGYQKTKPHQAIVSNSTQGQETSKQAAKGKWTSKIDIKHAKNPVWSLKY